MAGERRVQRREGKEIQELVKPPLTSYLRKQNKCFINSGFKDEKRYPLCTVGKRDVETFPAARRPRAEAQLLMVQYE